jgi:glycosyltransferase involved in cell wall biosynthesis
VTDVLVGPPAVQVPPHASARVLYVLKRYPQLSQTFVLRELLEVERAGVEVGIEALGPQASGPEHPEVGDVRATVRYLPRRPKLRDRGARGVHVRLALRHPVRWVRTARAARRQGDWRRFVQAGLVAERVRREGWTHLHAHFATAAAEVARDAAALAGCTFTVTAHAKDIYHHSHAPHLARRVRGAAAVITVSDFNVGHLRATLPGARLVHVPNGVGLEQRAPLPADGPLLCVARLVAKKGVDTLLRAVAQLADRDPDLRLEIAGDGELSDDLHRLADELDVGDRVRFLGSLSSQQIDAAYRRASMFVLPCRIDDDGDRDGMPTVILEAMARGVPVVSTDVIGIPEVVRHGTTGLLVPPDDPTRLAAAIETLRTDPEGARELGRAARALVAEKFDPQRSAELLREVFTRAVHGAPETARTATGV